MYIYYMLSAVEVFRQHSGELLDVLNALSNPVTIAWNLFAKQIITDATLQKVQVTGQPDYERNQIILEAVRNTVQTKPERLQEFIDVLTAVDAQSLTDDVVAKMRKELSELLST